MSTNTELAAKIAALEKQVNSLKSSNSRLRDDFEQLKGYYGKLAEGVTEQFQSLRESLESRFRNTG